MGGSSTINNCLVLESSKLSKLVKKGLKTDAVEVEWLEEEDRA